MDDVREHIGKFYSYHGIEVVRSNTETCVCTLPPQLRDIGALTADLYLEFGASVDLCLSNRDMEITIRRGSPPETPQKSHGSFFISTLLLLLVTGTAIVFAHTQLVKT